LTQQPVSKNDPLKEFNEQTIETIHSRD
jgi:hypothetical protein